MFGLVIPHYYPNANLWGQREYGMENKTNKNDNVKQEAASIAREIVELAESLGMRFELDDQKVREIRSFSPFERSHSRS